MSYVRISIASLVHEVVNSESGRIHRLVTFNPTVYGAGRKLLQPLGGAVELTELGRKALIRNFGAHTFEGFDARFLVFEEHVESVMKFFEERNRQNYEVDVGREVDEELTTAELKGAADLPGLPAILDKEDIGQVECVFERTVRQFFSAGSGTSPSSREGTPNRRLFYLHTLMMKPAIIRKMLASPAIRELSEAEIATTNGGRTKGSTTDGIAIADNVSDWLI